MIIRTTNHKMKKFKINNIREIISLKIKIELQRLDSDKEIHYKQIKDLKIIKTKE
jgi:hypothetical protein